MAERIFTEAQMRAAIDAAYQAGGGDSDDTGETYNTPEGIIDELVDDQRSASPAASMWNVAASDVRTGDIVMPDRGSHVLQLCRVDHAHTAKDGARVLDITPLAPVPQLVLDPATEISILRFAAQPDTSRSVGFTADNSTQRGDSE